MVQLCKKARQMRGLASGCWLAHGGNHDRDRGEMVKDVHGHGGLGLGRGVVGAELAGEDLGVGGEGSD